VVLVTEFVVVVTEKIVEYVHASAVLVLHSGSFSVVIWWSLPIVILGHGGNDPCSVKPVGHWIRSTGGDPGGWIPGGRIQCQAPPTWSPPHEMQMKKNQALQGTLTPSAVGSGAFNLFVIGSIRSKRGQVPQTGKGVVVDKSCPVLHAVVSVQCTETSAVVDTRNERTIVLGHPRSKVWVAESEHLVVTVMAGVANTKPVSSGQVTVDGASDGGDVAVVTVAPGAEIVDVMLVYYVVLPVNMPVFVSDSVPGSVFMPVPPRPARNARNIIATIGSMFTQVMCSSVLDY
jgi:hypothetical protein